MAIVIACERASGKVPGLGKDMACVLRQVRLSSSLQHRDSQDNRGLPYHREQEMDHLSLVGHHRRQVRETAAVQYPVQTVAPLMAVLGVMLAPIISHLQLCNTEDPAHGLVECLLHPLVRLQLTAVTTIAQVLCYKNVKSVPESDLGRGPKSAGQGHWLTMLDKIRIAYKWRRMIVDPFFIMIP